MKNIKTFLLTFMIFFVIDGFGQTIPETETIIDAISTDDNSPRLAAPSCPCRSSYSYSSVEIDVLNLINAHRQSIGLSTLSLINHISNNCLDHNTYMMDNNLVNHDYFQSRANNITCAINAAQVGEIVAYNFQTANSVLAAWLNSPGHKAIIEKPTYTHFGGSVKVNALGKKYYTVIFSQNASGACAVPGTIPVACESAITNIPNVTLGIDKRQAVNSITASNTINSGTGAIYHAGNTVVFVNSFHAKSGSTLHGYIAGCTGTFLARQATDTAVELDENQIDFTAKEADKKAPISISPNPTTGILKIASENLNAGTIQITDLFGTTIFKSDFKNQKEIEVNIQNQPKGIYIVKIVTANQTYTHKIIKN